MNPKGTFCHDKVETPLNWDGMDTYHRAFQSDPLHVETPLNWDGMDTLTSAHYRVWVFPVETPLNWDGMDTIKYFYN